MTLLGRVRNEIDLWTHSLWLRSRTVEGFAAGLRNEFDLERVGGRLGAIVGLALAPRAIGVWLRPSLRARGR